MQNAEIRTEIAAAEDAPRLWRMLTYAASMGGVEQVPTAMADPYLRKYVDAWATRATDVGFVAVAGDAVVGAAWVRVLDAVGPLAIALAGEPELAIGVQPDFRGRGVGKQLLERLLQSCALQFPSVVLSVRDENPAKRLYLRLGFEVVEQVTNRVGGTSTVMRKRFSDSLAAPLSG